MDPTAVGSQNQRTLSEIRRELGRIFSSDRVNVDEVTRLLQSCSCDPHEWESFMYFDDYRYTRNLVDSGNEKFNLMLLCWKGGQASGIHDHAGAHCFLKVIEGKVTETLYEWPEKFDSTMCNRRDIGRHPLKSTKTVELNAGDVTYIHDTIGLHRLRNPSYTNRAVTLHLYCPPYQECVNFEEYTGYANKCRLSFYSTYGERKAANLVTHRSVLSGTN